ncbi:gag-pol polyprotein, partial [Trifolium medium]|nr:gag-pol polyprotein [Trifolium medium]
CQNFNWHQSRHPVLFWVSFREDTFWYYGQGRGFVNRPPLLDGSNYDYWKSRMVAFLKSIDSKTWKAVVKGWEHPVIVDKDGNNTTELKSEGDWSKEEDELALGNSKALNASFNGVDKNMFRLIKQCIAAKDA